MGYLNTKMELKPGWGILNISFGMTRTKVASLLGNADLEFEDEDDNAVWVYRRLNLRLSFYADEDFRLAHIASNHPELEVNGCVIFSSSLEDIQQAVAPKGKWEAEEFDSTKMYSNEATWVTIIEDMGRIQRVEWGAWLAETTDDFIWRS